MDRRAADSRGESVSDPYGSAGDPLPAGRPPTSHERMAGRPWDASYRDEEPAPWDIGGPQPAVVRLAAAGAFTGEVLDVGCGTGENALHIAGAARNAGSGGAADSAGSDSVSGGVSVLGADVAETALAAARAKAAERGLDVEFRAADAFALDGLRRSFRTILDCGLFHTFDAEERPRYVASLARVTAKGGILFVLCFSDEDRASPHPVTRAELTAAFCSNTGWEFTELATDRVHTNFREDGAPAWLATITRI